MTIFSVAFEGDKPLDLYPELARKAEKYGFHSFQIYEHLPFKPAWPIAFLAGSATRRILVGPVTVPVFLHRPLTLARNLRALSELTKSRAILGISRGAYAENLGEKVERSISSVLNTIRFVDASLRDSKKVFRFELYVGTSGPKLAFKASLLKAVKGIVVDNLWNPEYAAKFRKILDEAQSKSRRKERVLLVARPFTMVASSKREAMRILDPILRSYLPRLVGDSPMLEAAGLTYQELLRIAEGKAKLPVELVENFAACGAPRDFVRRAEDMLEAGVDQICFGHPIGSDIGIAMKAISEEVVPNFN